MSGRRNFKTLLVMVVLLLSVGMGTSSVFAAGTYSGGDGSAENPYRIATPNDLNDIGSYPEDFNDCFILVNDINMAGFTYTTALIAPDTNNSSSGFQGTAFTGIFDGNDCNISSLTIDTAGAGNDYLGLFGQIDETGEVKNLGIENVNITGGDYSWHLGGLCGYNHYGTISNCYATGSVTSGDYSVGLGGLCGFNYGTINNCYAISVTGGDHSVYLGGLCGGNHGTISNCYATGSVTGRYVSSHLGGLCGRNYGTISNCYATGPVTGGYHYLGGLCGWNLYGTISNCYATGTVTGRFDSDGLGGLCGDNYYGTISNCYATGDVNGGEWSISLGGLCGYNYYGTISNCYAAGSVSGDWHLGGLCGIDDGGYYTSCIWDTNINPDVNGIGNTTDPNVIGKTTAEMQTKATFTDAGWDFVGETANGTDDIWRMCVDEVNYPHLTWQFVQDGDFLCPDGVDMRDFAVLAAQWRLEKLSADVAPDGGDGIVNFLDWAVFADGWQSTTDIYDLAVFVDQWLGSYCADIAPDGGDGVVNMRDLRILAENWLEGIQ